MKKKIIFVVVAVCLLVFVSVVAFSQSKTVDKWEYTILKYKDDDGLNSMGNQGWELIQILEIKLGKDQTVMGYNCVYKRKLP
jgi:uncharacterized protein YxeA